MQETVGTLGAQISNEVVPPVVAPVAPVVTEVKKEELVADPNYIAPDAPVAPPEPTKSEDPVEKKVEVDENPKSLQEILDEKAAHDEEETRKAELESKVNEELGVTTKETEEVKEIKDEVKAATEEAAKEAKAEIATEEPLVDIDTKKAELPKEAMKILQDIKTIYEKETSVLKVNVATLTAEVDVYKDKVKEQAQKIATLEGSGASASNKAIYFDQVMAEGNKEKITDYLIGLLGIHYPTISKEKLNSLVDKKKSFSTTVPADSERPVLTKTSKLDQLRSSYNGAYKMRA